MASAMRDLHHNQHIVHFGSEPDQEWTPPYTNSFEYCELNDIDWTDVDSLDDDFLNFDWMGQPVEDLHVTSLSGTFAGWGEPPDVSFQGLFLAEDLQEVFSPQINMSYPLEQPGLAQFSPSSTSRPFNTSYSTPSFYSPSTHPAISIPETPAPPSLPKNVYTCTTCQPNRSYSTHQNLK
jgi:hypothetical protein